MLGSRLACVCGMCMLCKLLPCPSCACSLDHRMPFTCIPALAPGVQAHEQLAAAQDSAHDMQDALKAARERGEAADLSVASLKAQLAEAKKEADARERTLQVRVGGAGW